MVGTVIIAVAVAGIASGRAARASVSDSAVTGCQVLGRILLAPGNSDDTPVLAMLRRVHGQDALFCVLSLIHHSTQRTRHTWKRRKKKMAFLMSEENLSSVSLAWSDMGREHTPRMRRIATLRHYNRRWEQYGFSLSDIHL